MIKTFSLEETIALGEQLGHVLRPGDVLALSGDIGVGKTQLVRGIAKSYIGSTDQVCSPSFTLINIYERAEKRIHHLDLYRLQNLEELESAGYWDAVEDPDALILIEWMEQIEKAEPIAFTHIWIDYQFEDDIPVEGLRKFTLKEAQNADLYQRLLPFFSPKES